MRILCGTIAALAFVAAGCTMETGRVVSPEYLARYEGGGSLSTLWYHGSDEQYHYFSHLQKVSTPYRIKRTELTWDEEFPYGSRQPATLVQRELSAYVKEKAAKRATADAERLEHGPARFFTEEASSAP